MLRTFCRRSMEHLNIFLSLVYKIYKMVFVGVGVGLEREEKTRQEWNKQWI